MNHHLPAHLIKTIPIAMILGIIAGVTLHGHDFGQWMDWIMLPGDLFMGLIQMVIVPLIITSIFLGVCCSGSLENAGRLGARLIPYFIMTTAIAVTIGLTLVFLIQPGNYVDASALGADFKQNVSVTPFENLTIPDRIMNMLPVNPAEAIVERHMLAIVVGSIMLGVAGLSLSAAARKSLIAPAAAIQDMMMVILGWAMHIAPLAVFVFLFRTFSSLGSDALISLGAYVLTVLLGLFSMIVVYGLFIRLWARRPVLDTFNKIKSAQMIAFSTSSSAATMPVSLAVAEERLKVDPAVSGTVIPLGATINMDGTALYQAIAAVFLFQLYGPAMGLELEIGQIVLLLLTTIGASIGTPATPGVGLIVLATILASIGLPAEAIGLIIGVDRLLDMCRTTVNVTGDLTATCVMDRLLTRPAR